MAGGLALPRIGLGLRGRAPSGPQPQLFTGAEIGGFSSSNNLTSAAGQRIPFAPGSTLIVAIETTGAIAASWGNIFSSTDGAAFGSEKGFLFFRAGSDAGANAGKFVVLGGANVSYTFAPPANGVTLIALVWRVADNSVWFSVNGGPSVQASTIVTATPQDGTCSTRVGGPVASFAATSNTRVLAFSVLPSELTATQAAAATYTPGNRFALPAAATTGASVDFNASRDWNGVASSILTKGSAPITLTVNGSPTLYAVSETVYGNIANLISDSRLANPQTDGSGNKYVVRRAFARRNFVTDALTAAVDVYSNNTNQPVIGLCVGGAWTSETAATIQASPQTFELALGAGSAKACSVWDGPQVLAASLAGSIGTGAFVVNLRLRNLLSDGVTAAHSSATARAAPQKRLLFKGDSIFCGYSTTTMSEHGLIALVRGDFPTSGTGGVTAATIGEDSIFDIASTQALSDADAAAMVAELDGAASNVVAVNYGTNDYGFIVTSAAAFSASATRWLASINAAVVAAGTPGFALYWFTPIQRIAPASEAANAAGSTLADFRAVISGFAGAYPWLHIVNGAAGALVPNADIGSDGIHPTTDANLKASIKTALGY